jgi:hypothetical protein
MKNSKTKYIIAGMFAIALVSLPAILYLSNKQQEIRSKASASTILYFEPIASPSSPLEVKIGDPIKFDVMINPGTNLPSVVTLNIRFDPTKIQATPTSFLVNSQAFSTTLEGPILTDGNLNISLSIGSDTTKAIQTTTKVGQLTFTAIAPTTNEPTAITFGNNTSVLSVGATDYATENTLSTTSPGHVRIIGPVTPTPIASSSTTLSLTAFLHSIGASGDNSNPNDSRLSNKSPQHPNRPVDIYIYNNQNQLVASNSGKITYDPTKGNFTGTINIDGNILPQGNYTLKIQSPSYLRRLIPGIQTIIPLQENKLPEVTLVTGDIINDNMLNILDYNILIGCYSDLSPAKSCTDANKILSDLNDDGAVNQVDYNIFLREISVQTGN